MTPVDARKLRKDDAVLIHGKHLSSRIRGWRRAQVVSVRVCRCSRCRKLPIRERNVDIAIRLDDRIWHAMSFELRRARRIDP